MIYIDSDYKCHAENGEGRRGFNVPLFDGKCAEFIEGYRYIPAGETWTREDGVTFKGEMVSPWRDSNELEAAQRTQEKGLLAEYEEALKVVGVKV